MKDLNNIIEDVEKALWELQNYFNQQPKEDMPGYFGTCQNEGSINAYRLRIEFAKKFPKKQVSMVRLHPDQFVEFTKYYKEYKTWRFGQAFCNEYKIQDPTLFYEQDRKRAIEYIYEHYIYTGDKND